jgi:hypothetical protein
MSFGAVIDALHDVLERETALVRAGRLGDANQLHAAKAALTARYVAEAQHVKPGGRNWQNTSAAARTHLRARHARLQTLMQVNLTVLATAHAVAESLVRGVVAEVTRKQAPQTYGPAGRATLPSARSAKPVVFSRSL